MKRAGCFAKVLVLVFAASWATAQVQSGTSGHILITQPIDEGKLVTLKSNTRPEATAANDRGAVEDQFPVEHMLLHLRRSPASEQALQKFITGLQTPGSPNFHHWITPQEFGNRFGLAKPDLATVTDWLQSHGFKVNVTYPNGMMIDFSGTAGQVREAFRTEIHRLQVNGRTHIANMSDPQIPSALAPAVAGIVSLHDFMPRTMYEPRPAYTFTTNGTFEGVVPADLATIYNLNLLFNGGTSGQGQTIVVIEDTDVPNGSNNPDWPTFRSTFGLSSYNGSFTQVNPQPPSGGPNCSDPGVNANDIEAILDAEYASAAAPSATIELASCSDSGVTFGGLIALQNLLNQSGTPPAIVSISYGECESTNGATANLAYSSTYAQAVTEGVSIFVAAGDEGAAGCDPRTSVALHGIGVSGFASTPYNVAVGGTDFGDTYAGTTNKYWSATNTATYGSAQSYVPEIPWNNSCASVLIANFDSFSTTYGASGFCNSSTGASFLTTAAGSGGPSGCATGTANTAGEVDGTCAGWPKPAWQAVVGNPADNVRDLPDVSLFAANGVWGHYYIFCDSDVTYGGTPCTPGNPSAWSGAGGTSFGAPIMAGIQALVNQKTGASQGNPNPIYYSLAAAEFGSAGNASCNSTLGSSAANSCIFYDTTLGDMDLACYTGSPNCYQPSSGASYGVLSTSNSSYSPAYGTATGWDFATGLGTLNAANLVSNWPTATTPNFSLSATPNNLTIAQAGTAGSSTIAITPTNSFTGSVNLWVSGVPNGVTASFDQNPTTSTAHLTLTASGTAPVGTFTVTIFGASGSLSHTATVSLSVAPAFSLLASPNSLSITQGASGGTSTITIAPATGFSGAVNFSATGLPSGVTAGFSPNTSTTATTLTLTAAYGATLGTSNVTIVGTYGAVTETTTISLTVVASPPPNFSLTASPNSIMITQGGIGGSTGITVASLFNFSGNVTLSASGLPNRVTASFSSNPTAVTGTANGASTLTLTAGSTATLGTVSVTITGISGGLTSTTTVSLNVSASASYPPSFQLPATYSAGTGPTAVAVGNFNGDSYPDLAVANGGDNTVSVLLGNKDGTFQSAVISPVGSSPSALAVGNFNGDGHMDLAVANGGDNTVSVLIGNGDGTFGAAATSPISVGKNPTGVAVGDFNNDGNLDLVVANGGDNTVSVLVGNGDGTFKTASSYPVGSSPTAVAVGDFNGDGNLDLVVANAGDNTVSVLVGNGDGTFKTAVSYPVGTGPTAVVVGDGDVDGIADIVVANGGSNTVSVLVGNGDGTFKTAVSYAVGTNPTAVALGDFNGDGKQDVAVANAVSNTVSILPGNGDCTFQAATTFPVGNKPVSLAVGDFNQDVQPDVAVANQVDNDVAILLNNASIQAPAITSGNGATFKVLVPGAFTVTAGGFPVITAAGQLPGGVIFNDNRDGTASIAGTPAAGTGGSYPITLTASPKNGPGSAATQNFTLQVNQAAGITTPNSTTFTVGSQGSFTVTASGYPAPVLTESGALPNGVTFNGGILSGTPAAGTGGTYSITFTAHNGIGADATQTFTVIVDQAPAFTSGSAVSFVSGTLGAFTVTTVGFPVSTLSVTSQLPGGVTFTDNGNGTGSLNAATNAATGVFALTFGAQNGVGAPAIQNFTLTIGASQTITFQTSAPATAAYGSSFTVVATGGGSGNPVVFSSSGVCSNVGATYTMTTGTGTCSVIANQAGSSGYLPASQVTQTTTATLALNPITFTIPAPAQAATFSSFTVAATGTGSNPVVYESYGTCRNSGATYTMWEGRGTCTVTAFQFNDNNYASGSTSETTQAIPASQTITFTTNAPASASFGSTFTVAATGGASGIPVVFTSSGACTNNGSTYTMTAASGNCSVIANQAASVGPYYLYAAAPTVTETTMAALATQTITFTTKAPTSAPYNSSFNVAASASSGLPITYSSSGSCRNSGATYTMTSGTGNCSVTASQPGNSNYSPANPVTETTTATQLPQSITFTTSAPSTAVYGTSFAVVANASSGLPITFTSSGACSNAAATYNMTSGTGTCSVIANQPGNSNYVAAHQVTQSTTAQKAAASVSISNIPGNAVAGKSFSPTYTTNSNGTASVTSSTSTTCSVSGNTVSFRAAGTCTLVAHTASTSNYNAGTGTSQSFTIIAITLTSISPNSGLRGTNFQVTLNGNNLSNATAVVVSGSGVTVSNISSTATTVTATFTIAANATVSSRTVSVTTPIGNSNTVAFAVTGPTLTSISPNTGSHGTTVAVTLTGTNLTGASSISVSGGGVQVTGLTVTSPTTVTANFVISSGATLSNRSVTVTTPIGTTGSVTFRVQ